MYLKDHYYENQPEYYVEELNKCFEKIEKFCSVYETLYSLSDFIEDIKLFNSRLSNNPQKITIKTLFTHVINELNYSLTIFLSEIKLIYIIE